MFEDIMKNNPIFLKSGEEKSRLKTPGKLFRLMVKTENLEAIIAEIDPHSASRNGRYPSQSWRETERAEPDG